MGSPASIPIRIFNRKVFVAQGPGTYEFITEPIPAQGFQSAQLAWTIHGASSAQSIIGAIGSGTIDQGGVVINDIYPEVGGSVYVHKAMMIQSGIVGITLHTAPAASAVEDYLITLVWEHADIPETKQDNNWQTFFTTSAISIYDVFQNQQLPGVTTKVDFQDFLPWIRCKVRATSVPNESLLSKIFEMSLCGQLFRESA